MRREEDGQGRVAAMTSKEVIGGRRYGHSLRRLLWRMATPPPVEGLGIWIREKPGGVMLERVG